MGYTLHESDRCEATSDHLYDCDDDLGYCLDAAETEWRRLGGDRSFAVCVGTTTVVSFRGVGFDPDAPDAVTEPSR
jgi:hypothetical protein